MTVPAFIRYLVEMPRPVPAAWPSTELISGIFFFVAKQTKGAGLMLGSREAIAMYDVMLPIFMQCLKDATSVGLTAGRQ